MESSEPSIQTTSEPPTQRWAGILGMAIAILTLVIPTLAIVYYSSPNPRDSILRTTLPTTRPIADQPNSSQDVRHIVRIANILRVSRLSSLHD